MTTLGFGVGAGIRKCPLHSGRVLWLNRAWLQRHSSHLATGRLRPWMVRGTWETIPHLQYMVQATHISAICTGVRVTTLPAKSLTCDMRGMLTYTLTLAGPTGMNIALRDSLPSGVQYVTNTITSTLVPPAIYEPESKSVTWVGDLPSDLVHIRFQATPGITRTGSLSLIRPIVNTAWLTDTKRGTSVSASAIVNGWRVYLPLALR